MESLEVSAKTVNEAIRQALALLGKSREDVVISVLSEGSRGILGIGGEEARILVSVREPAETTISPAATGSPEAEIGSEEDEIKSTENVAETAKQILETLLREMHVDARVVVHEGNDEDANGLTLDIEGEDLGLLIGRRGETLSSLQFLVNQMASKQLRRWTKVAVDVAGYRVRRQDTLKGLAMRMADRVRVTRQPVTLEAMPAYERRIVHLAIQGNPHATTQSVGEGDDRKVMILPR